MLCDFFVECDCLARSRSQFSTPETKSNAVLAAVNEQRQKWKAICHYYPVLKMNDFDNLVKRLFSEKEVATF